MGGNAKDGIYKPAGSIKKAKKPERNPVATTNFYAVNGKIAIGQILDLMERLLLANDFKEMLPIDKAVTTRRKLSRIADRKLVVEKDFTERTFVWRGNESIHQIRVVAKQLAWCAQMLQRVRVFRQHPDESSTPQRMKDLESLLSVHLQASTQP